MDPENIDEVVEDEDIIDTEETGDEGEKDTAKATPEEMLKRIKALEKSASEATVAKAKAEAALVLEKKKSKIQSEAKKPDADELQTLKNQMARMKNENFAHETLAEVGVNLKDVSFLVSEDEERTVEALDGFLKFIKADREATQKSLKTEMTKSGINLTGLSKQSRIQMSDDEIYAAATKKQVR